MSQNDHQSYHTQKEDKEKQGGLNSLYDSQTSTQKPPLQKLNSFKRLDDNQLKTSRVEHTNLPRPYIQKPTNKVKLSFDSSRDDYHKSRIDDDNSGAPFCLDDEFSRIYSVFKQHQAEDVESSSTDEENKSK